MRRKPTSPGEILKHEFLIPLGITQKELSDHIKCDVKVVNRLVNEKCRLTADMAIKLSASFKMSAEFWLNAQQALDIYYAEKELRKKPKPLAKAG